MKDQSKNPFSEKEKKFSILTPTYGDKYLHLEHFAHTLDLQEYKNFEWINIFDGPNKKGVKVMDKLIKKYPDMDISYHVIEHGGICKARNESTKYATGDFYVHTSPDCWLYPETLRMWANDFEDPTVNKVWGMYDVVNENGEVMFPVGQAPVKPNGDVWYPAFKFQNYSDSTFPIRAEFDIPFDENCTTLVDWEWNVRYLKQDNFSGKGWKYVPYHYFSCETPQKGGLSNQSHSNWEEKKKYVQEVNGIETKDICVTSLGAQPHAFNVAEMLDCEFLPMPSFKDHHYKGVYLLGFYSRENGQSRVTQTHMDVFSRNKGKNIIHWIGTDILDLYWHCSYMKLKTLRKWFKENNVIHLCEADFTQKELAEIGIDAQVVPIPPKKLYEPMPLPEKFTVGVYLPGSETYKPAQVMEAVKSLPDVQFYFFGDEEHKGLKGDNWEHLGYIDFDEWMPKFSCNLRLTNHDGLPITPLQFLTAGRNVVTTVPLKGAIHVEETLTKFDERLQAISDFRERVVEGIRKAQDNPLDPKVSEYWTKQLDHKKYVKSIRGLL